MLKMIKKLINKSPKALPTEEPKKLIKKKTNERAPIYNVIMSKLDEEVTVTTKPLKSTCDVTAHSCLAIELTNRMICMVEEFEANMERIQKHPTLPDSTKADIQNYINKTLVTSLWALSPSFDLMASYPRIKNFRQLYLKSMKTGAPGILNEKKHI